MTPETTREHIVSAILTFLGSFGTLLVAQLVSEPSLWDVSTWSLDAASATFGGAILTAVRAALKATISAPITKAVGKVI